jgi:hypothetical protein
MVIWGRFCFFSAIEIKGSPDLGGCKHPASLGCPHGNPMLVANVEFTIWLFNIAMV